MRVPAPLVAKYGRVLRVHLQTQERSVAQHKVYQMAGQWLARFQAESLDPGQLNQLTNPANRVPSIPITPEVPPQPEPQPTDSSVPPLTCPGYPDLYNVWKRIDPDRDPTILRGMRAIADQLKLFCKKSPYRTASKPVPFAMPMRSG